MIYQVRESHPAQTDRRSRQVLSVLPHWLLQFHFHFWYFCKENPLFYNGEVIASNNSLNPIDNIKINFLVLKFITLKIGEVSGSHLDPNQSLGLKKTFTLQSNDPNKKIVIKIKLSYSIDGKDETTMITLDNI
jgi:hypothetical protein